MIKKYIFPVIGIILCLALGFAGFYRFSMQNNTGTSSDSNEIIEYNGICKKKSDLSEETLRWLSWYQSLPEDQQHALSFVPTEFTASGTVTVMETDDPEDADPSPSYLNALSETDRYETEELARYYFTELSGDFGGVEEVQPVSDDSPMYGNKGIEDSYSPGNIIIYYVLTQRDIDEGTPMRSISIARRSKSDEWKVVNCGY